MVAGERGDGHCPDGEMDADPGDVLSEESDESRISPRNSMSSAVATAAKRASLSADCCARAQSARITEHASDLTPATEARRANTRTKWTSGIPRRSDPTSGPGCTRAVDADV
eukprot:scaffold81484_cov31-Tisochrysis_lutea.AAC.8